MRRGVTTPLLQFVNRKDSTIKVAGIILIYHVKGLYSEGANNACLFGTLQ